MLLSMYASYHWARKENYVRNMGFFLLLISFFSAFSPDLYHIMFVFAFPFTFLSFPLYAHYEELWIDGIVGDWSGFAIIRFLTIDITSIPTEAAFFHLPRLIPAFPLFLTFNILGALLGYWIGTKHRLQFFSSKRWKFLWGVVGIASIGLGFVLGAMRFIWEDPGSVLFVFGIVVFETMILSYLLNNWTSIISVK